MVANILRKLRIRISDSLRNGGLFRNASAVGHYAASRFARNASTAHSRALAAFQRSEYLPSWAHFAARVHLTGKAEPSRIPVTTASRYQRYSTQQTQLTRSLILKSPGPNGERGVLLVQFEYNWFRLLQGLSDLQPLSKDYEILWGTSWSPTDYALLDVILARTSGPVYVLPSNFSDTAKLQAFDARIHCPPLLSACDWVNPVFFNPKPQAERGVDILVVANWAPFKRHFELFAALRHMPSNLRVTLVGQPEGGYTAAHIRLMLRLYGVTQDVEMLESLPIDEVTRLQCDSRVALILSLREGSCVAATEALFAGAALGMRHGAHVGAAQHVNPSTGMLLRGGRHLAEDLTTLLEKSASLTPQIWALKNISCHVSLQKLEHFIKSKSEAAGLPWTRGLAAYHWHPYPAYISSAEAEALRPAYADLHRRYPAAFSADLSATSHL